MSAFRVTVDIANSDRHVGSDPKRTFATVYAVFDLAGVF